MAKATTIKIKLLSTADTGTFYVTTKNSRTFTDKMTKTKYDPVVRKHVEFKETKIKYFFDRSPTKARPTGAFFVCAEGRGCQQPLRAPEPFQTANKATSPLPRKLPPSPAKRASSQG